jgi:hypothetical membrane protein
MDSQRLPDPLLVRYSAISGIAAPVIFTLTVGILGFIQPGYSHLSQLMSELGETGAPYAIIMNVLGFGLFGILIVGFAPGLYFALRQRRTAFAGSAFILAAGVAFIAMAFLPCDTACVPVTTAGRMHLVLGLVAVIAAVMAACILAYPMRMEMYWHGFWIYSLASGVLVLLLLPFFLSVQSYEGMFQRLMVAVILVWTEVIAIRLYQAAAQLESGSLS